MVFWRRASGNLGDYRKVGRQVVAKRSNHESEPGWRRGLCPVGARADVDQRHRYLELQALLSRVHPARARARPSCHRVRLAVLANSARGSCRHGAGSPPLCPGDLERSARTGLPKFQPAPRNLRHAGQRPPHSTVAAYANRRARKPSERLRVKWRASARGRDARPDRRGSPVQAEVNRAHGSLEPGRPNVWSRKPVQPPPPRRPSKRGRAPLPERREPLRASRHRTPRGLQDGPPEKRADVVASR